MVNSIIGTAFPLAVGTCATPWQDAPSSTAEPVTSVN
jgi:hypothetical protein